MIDFRLIFAHNSFIYTWSGESAPPHIRGFVLLIERGSENCVISVSWESMAQQEHLRSDGLIARASGAWAKEKLYYLERYLDIVSVGMKKKWAGKLFYVDLFAGPGKCWIRETNEEIDGSPLIALKFNFAKYFFVESDEKCYQALAARVKVRAPEKDVETIHGDCNDVIEKIELPSSSLGVAFVDPTGVSQLAFETIGRLALNRKVDLIVNFPEGMGIRMNLFHTQKLKRMHSTGSWAAPDGRNATGRLPHHSARCAQQ